MLRLPVQRPIICTRVTSRRLAREQAFAQFGIASKTALADDLHLAGEPAHLRLIIQLRTHHKPWPTFSWSMARTAT